MIIKKLFTLLLLGSLGLSLHATASSSPLTGNLTFEVSNNYGATFKNSPYDITATYNEDDMTLTIEGFSPLSGVDYPIVLSYDKTGKVTSANGQVANTPGTYTYSYATSGTAAASLAGPTGQIVVKGGQSTLTFDPWQILQIWGTTYYTYASFASTVVVFNGEIPDIGEPDPELQLSCNVTNIKTNSADVNYTISWLGDITPADGTVTGYKITYGDQTLNLETSQTSGIINLTGLQCYHDYTYSFTAQALTTEEPAPDGYSASQTVSFKTDFGNVSSFTATVDDQNISYNTATLNYSITPGDKISSEAISNYTINVYTSSTKTQLQSFTVNDATGTVQLTNLDPSTTYYLYAQVTVNLNPSSDYNPTSDETYFNFTTTKAPASLTIGNEVNVTPDKYSATIEGTVTAANFDADPSVTVSYTVTLKDESESVASGTVNAENNSFSIALSDLTPATEYSVTLEATADDVTSEKVVSSFTTQALNPTLTVTVDTDVDVTKTTASINGTVTSEDMDDDAEITVYYTVAAANEPATQDDDEDTQDPDTTTPASVKVTDGEFTIDLSDLTPGTEYTVTIYAQSGDVKSADVEVSFTTEVLKPSLTVTADSDVTVSDTSATITGEVAAEDIDADAEISVYYTVAENNGTDTQDDATPASVTVTNGKFVINLINLTADTEYTVTLYAQSGDTTSAEATANFTTTSTVYVPQTTVEIGNVTNSEPDDDFVVTFTVPVTVTDLGEEDVIEVTYSYDEVSGTATGSNGTYTFSIDITDMEANSVIDITIKATAGSASDSVVYNYTVPKSTGVSGIITESGNVRYFNLNGFEVKNPKAGTLVIKVEGKKVTKEIIK